MLNYMDRLTLNLTGVQIMRDFGLDERGYGRLESAFAFAFALGAIIFGWLADRWPVRWLYPAAVLAWSVAGFSTGLATTFLHLLICRALLGLFEAGNWPCALRTTQHILTPSERTLGNSILQSGAALGAIFTPLIVIGLAEWSEAWQPPWPGAASGLWRGAGSFTTTAREGWLALPPAAGWGLVSRLIPVGETVSNWRPAFLVVGILGASWAVLWLPSVRRTDLQIARGPSGPTLVSILGWLVALLAVDTYVHSGSIPDAPSWLPLATKAGVTVLGIAGVFLWLRRATQDDTHLPRKIFFFRFWALVALVVAINTTWHYFRAWLPLFLQTQHNYSQTEAGWFTLAYYVATDIGSLTSGFVVLWLARAGMAVHWSRVTVFLVCALLTLLGLVVAALPAGPLLFVVLLVIGFSSLALFPIYYSFSQDLTVRNQGKVTGALGCINWLAMSLLHEGVGESIRRTGNYAEGLALAGLAPLVGFAVLMLLWRQMPPAPAQPEPPPTETPAAPGTTLQAPAAPAS
jgi:MFS family permease